MTPEIAMGWVEVAFLATLMLCGVALFALIVWIIIQDLHG